jgi:MoaA/NifB/PqqE/SkfB family radical SAM enzyme
MTTHNRGNYYGAALRLLGNALWFRYSRLRGTPLKPQVVSLAVTNRCNSHCIMCNMWRRAREIPDIKTLELTGDEIIGLLSRPLFSGLVELDLTGGEPHLRDDLADITLGIGRLKSSFLPKLRSIIITSNGLLPGKVVSNYQKILEGLRGTNIDLVSVASFDGVDETHDKVRGTKGAFKLAVETLDGLLGLRKEYPNYFIGLKTTILPENIHALDAILDFALERNLFHIISPAFFTETRFRNIEKREKLALSPAQYEEILKFYNRPELKTSYFYSRARNFLAAGRKQWTCTALNNYLFIEFDGKVYPCELLPEPVGDLRKQSIEDIWYGRTASEWRSRINKTEHCRACHEPGALRYSASAEGFSYLRFLIELGRRRFSESLHNEGYIKYLGH